jgi:murein DD-endopeptidase MepM/ murein hydrolase activator NlpD
MLRTVLALTVAGIVVGAVAAAAFGGGGDASRGKIEGDWIAGATTPTRPATERPTRVPATPSPEPTRAIEEVSGLGMPIDGACLPESPNLLPGALREYRNAIHEGLDFYDFDNCASIGPGTEVLAVAGGVVIRADRDYEDLTADDLAELEELSAEGHGDDEAVKDAFRGRQVWVDHGGGLVTRYAHLGGIAEGIEEGAQVRQGDLIAFVGDSGTPESVTNPGTEHHLHLEVRVGDAYLGEGLPPDEVRALYERAFSP